MFYPWASSSNLAKEIANQQSDCERSNFEFHDNSEQSRGNGKAGQKSDNQWNVNMGFFSHTGRYSRGTPSPLGTPQSKAPGNAGLTEPVSWWGEKNLGRYQRRRPRSAPLEPFGKRRKVCMSR
jgi:hypothetical protein